MADNIEHLMLEQFRHVRADIANMKEMIRELNREMHAFRHHVRGNELDIEANRNSLFGLQSRMERVERRLELSGDPVPPGLSEPKTRYRSEE